MTEFRILVIRLQATSSENVIPSSRILSLIRRLLDRLLVEFEFKYFDTTRLVLDCLLSMPSNLRGDFNFDFKGVFAIFSFKVSTFVEFQSSLSWNKDIECERGSFNRILHHFSVSYLFHDFIREDSIIGWDCPKGVLLIL